MVVAIFLVCQPIRTMLFHNTPYSNLTIVVKNKYKVADKKGNGDSTLIMLSSLICSY